MTPAGDRIYADHDPMIGAVDPRHIFRIFHEIHCYRWETGREPDMAYTIGQSHNLRPKIEEMIPSVMAA